MDILLLLIPLSLVFIVTAIFAFRWAIKTRQFEDLESPSMIPLLDDDSPLEKNNQQTIKHNEEST